MQFRNPADVANGYPLSKYLSSFAKHKLSYIALEVACHAIESYCDKLKTGNYEDLIVKYRILEMAKACYYQIVLFFRCTLTEPL